MDNEKKLTMLTTDGNPYAEVQPAPVKKKRRLHADAFLLMVISFVVLAALSAFTFLQNTDTVLSGAEAEEVEETDSELGFDPDDKKEVTIDEFRALYSTMDEESRNKFLQMDEFNSHLDDAFDVTYDEETGIATEHFYRVDENGEYVLDEHGDKIIDSLSNYYEPGSFVILTINPDETYGLESEVTTQSQLDEVIQNKAAYANATLYGNYWHTWSPWNWCWSNWGDQWGNYASCSNGGGCSSSVVFYFNISDGVWNRWRNCGRIYTYWNNRAYGVNWGGSCRNNWSTIYESGGSYMQAYAYTACPSNSCCSSYSASCQVHLWGEFRFAHNDYTTPWATPFGCNSWVSYRSSGSFGATFYGNSNGWGTLLYRVHFSVSQDQAGNSWSDQFYTSGWAWRCGWDGNYFWYPWADSASTYSCGNCWSRAYWWCYDTNNYSNAGYWNADTLKIDWKAPWCNYRLHVRTADWVGGSVVQDGSTNQAGSPYAGGLTSGSTLYFTIQVIDNTDNSACCGVSGISYVDIYRNGAWWGRMNNRGNGWYTFPVAASNCDAYWHVVTYDNAGNGRWLYWSYWVSNIDCSAPVIGNCSVDYNASINEAGSHWTVSDQGKSNYWTSAIYKLNVYMEDSIGQNYFSNAYYAHNGIQSVSIIYYLNGAKKQSAGYVDTSKGAFSYANVGRTASFYLPQDYTKIQQSAGGASGFVISVKDYAGHTTNKTFDASAFNYGSGKIRMDTDAPSVSVSINGGGSSWIGWTPTITITANDSSSYSGASGTRAVYIYNTSATTTSKPIATLPTTTCTNGGISGNTTWTWNVDRDAVQIASYSRNNPVLYFVAVDHCGNRSDSYNGYNTQEGNNKSWNGSSYSYGNATTTYWTGTSANQTVYLDTYQPYMAFTITTTYSNNTTSTASFNSGTSLQTYTCRYDNDIKKINIQFNTALGCSGGSVRLEGNASGTYTYNEYRGVNNSNYYTFSSKSTWSSTGNGSTTKVVSFDVTAQGAGTYTFTYTGNNGKKSYAKVITQIDNTLPSLTLKGYLPYETAQQLGSNATTNSSIINNLSTNMKATTFFDGKWTSKSWYALFQVADAHSGVTYIENGSTSYSNGSKSYGLNGGSTQNSECKTSTVLLGQGNTTTYQYTLGNKTYTKSFNADIRHINGNYYLQVPIYELSGVTSGGTALKDALCFGAPQISYYIFIRDFVGNETYTKITINYDPKDITIEVLDMFETEETITNNNGKIYVGSQEMPTNSASITSKLSGMSSVSTYTAGNWSRKKVVVRFAYTPSVSSPIVGLTNSAGSSIVGSDCTAYTVINNYETWYVFDANCRQLNNLQITQKSQAFDYNGNGTAKVTNKIKNNDINIWQDNVGPNITGYFFSSTPNLTSIPAKGDGNILLYFDVAYVNNAYTTTYNANKSSRSDTSQWSTKNNVNYIWTTNNVYMYFVVNDKTNTMSGSGVKSVSSSGDTYAPKSYTSSVATETLYCSNQDYQYDSTKSYSITAYDNAGNASKTIQIGGTSTTGTKLLTLPYVDKTGPFVKLSDSVYSAENESGAVVQKSYTHNTTKDDDSVKVGAATYTSKIKNFNGEQGEYFGGSDVAIDLIAFSGKSGYQVYMRRRETNTEFSDLLSFNVGTAIQDKSGTITGYTPLSMPANYDYAANGWGQYIDGNFVQNGKPVASKVANPVDGVSNYNGTQTVSITADTISGYFDFLIVTGVNTYYLIEAGKFMLDRGSPVFYEDMTIFAMHKEDLGTNIDISTIADDMIWSTQVGDGYTNGSVDVYLCVDDGLSGINGVYSNPSMTTEMETVTVTGMKLFVVSGATEKTVKYRLTGTPTNIVASDHNGRFRITFNYVGDSTKIIVDSDIEYSSSATVSYCANATVTYYRYKANETENIALYAKDNVGNKLLLGKSDLGIRVKIDTTSLADDNKFKIYTSTYEEDDQGNLVVVDYDSTDDNKYSNQAVTVEITSLFGESGFGSLHIQEDNYYDSTNKKVLTTPTTSSKDVYLPTIENHNGVTRFTWTDYEGNTVTKDIYVASSQAFGFPASDSMVIGVVKETTKGKASYFWTVKSGDKACKIVDSTGAALPAISETKYDFWVNQITNQRETTATVYFNSVYKVGNYTVADASNSSVVLPTVINNGGYLRLTYKNNSGSTDTYDVYEKSTTSESYYRVDAVTDNAKIAIKNNCWYINDKKLFYLSGSTYTQLPQPNVSTYAYYYNHSDIDIRFYVGEDGLTYTVNGLNLPEITRSSTGGISVDFRNSSNAIISDALLCDNAGTLFTFPTYGNMVLGAKSVSGKYALTVDGKDAYYVTTVGGNVTQCFLSAKEYALLTTEGHKVTVQFTTDDINYKVLVKMIFADTENGNKVNHKYVYTANSYNGVSYANDKATDESNNKRENKSASVKYNIFMDTEAPEITLSSDMLAELARWTKSEKLLNCTVKDSLSGLNILSDEYLKDVALEYTDTDTETGKSTKYTYLMVDAGNSTNTFYPVSLLYSSVGSIAKNNTYKDYVYLDKKITYTIIAVDKAGNRAEYYVTPNIDTTSAEMSDIKLYKINEDQTTAGTYTVDTWSSLAVKLVANVSYGDSKYVVQTGNIEGNNDGKHISNWETLDLNEDYIISESNGKNKDTIEIYFANTSVTAFHKDYAVRVLSEAEYNDWQNATEKNIYNGKELSYSRDIIKSTTSGKVTVQINGADKEKEVGVLSIEKGTETKSYTLDGIHYIGKIKVDKVVPTIEDLVVYANAEYPNEAYEIDTKYGGLISENAKTWKCAQSSNNWVNNTVRITFKISGNKGWSNGLDYASGNYIYFTDVKPDAGSDTVSKQDYSRWYRIDPITNTLEKYSNGSWTETDDRTSLSTRVVKGATTGAKYYEELTVELTESQQGTRYQFYVQSGAGLESDIYTVTDIQSDVNTPDISISFKETYDRFTRSAGVYDFDELESAYNSTDSATYTVGSTFTVKNSIIVKMSIGNISYSGATVRIKIGDQAYEDYTTISYEEFNEKKDELTQKMTVYYVVDQNGEYTANFQVVENATTNDLSNAEEKLAIVEDENASDIDDYRQAVRHYAEASATIKMDNTVPIITVTELNATKASDWEYAEEDDKYYTKISLKLKVGYVEYNTTNQRWEYKQGKSPYSDIHLKYSTDSGDSWDLIDTSDGKFNSNDNTFEIKLADGKAVTYQFKVYSDAGVVSGNYPIYFTLGNILHSNKFVGDVYENIDEIYYQSVAYTTDFDGEEIKESAICKLQKVLGGIMGHKVNGDTNVDSFTYTGDIEYYSYIFNVDTHDYSYSFSPKLLVGFDEQNNEVYDSTSDFATTGIEIGDWANAQGGSFSLITDPTKKYKHGDLLMFTYATNSSIYYQIRTELSDGLDFFGAQNLFEENSGSAYFKFYGGKDVNINIYFGAELSVSYSDKLFYLQGKGKDEILSPTATTSYSYDSGKKTVYPTLSKEYYVMEGDTFTQVQATEKAGAYYITPYISQYSVANKSIDEALGTGYFEYVGEYVRTADEKYKSGTVYYTYNSTADTYEKITPYVGATIEGDVYEFVEYKQTTDEKVKSGKTYYVRNGNGDFRVKVRGSGEHEIQYYVIRYFRPVVVTEENIEKTYYYVNNEEEFSYMDDPYYELIDDYEHKPEPAFYSDVTNVTFQLQNDMTVGDDMVIERVFKTALDGNGKVVTLADGETYYDVNNEKQRIYSALKINKDYALFNTVAGVIKNLEVRVYGDECEIESDEAVSVGLFAQTIQETAILSNITVIGDMKIVKLSSENNSYIGALAAKVESTDGSKKAVLGSQDDNAPIYVSTRIYNTSALQNVYVGALFGSANNEITLDYVLVTQELTIAESDEYTVHVGVLAGQNESNVKVENDGLRYFANDTFYNDEVVVSTLSGGLTYDDFINNCGEVSVVDGTVKARLLSIIYKDFFGISYDGVSSYGDGTNNNPLRLTTVAYDDTVNKKISENISESDYSVLRQLAMVDNYMLLNYVWTEDVDLTNFTTRIAAHKVFSGSVTTPDEKPYVILNNYGVMTDEKGNEVAIETDDKVFGFFGHLSGTVQNLVFRNVSLDVEYTGTGAFSFGVLAGEIDSATVHNVIIIGEASVVGTQEGSIVRAGAVSGYAYGGKVYDVFSMANMAVTATKMTVGGMIGQTDDKTKLSNGSEGTLFALGRVETTALSSSNDTQSMVGAVVGKGGFVLGTGGTNIYGIVKNVYNMGLLEATTVTGSGVYDAGRVEMVSFDDKNMRGKKLENDKNVFDVVFGTNGYYPLAGTGLSGDEFQVTNEEDFHNINLALYAKYRIKNDITFTNFETIGEGLYFTGTIDGGDSTNISAEESNVVSLINVTGPLVYNILGTVKNLSVNLACNYEVEDGETFVFGGIAVKSEGTITNITVGGTVNIVGKTKNTTAIVSGFVGISYGGTIGASLVNNITALELTVQNVGTVIFGGYAGEVAQGTATFSYGLATGNVNIVDCTNVSAGLLVGQVHGECAWTMTLEEKYFYNIYIAVDDKKVPVDKVDEKLKDKDNPYGITNLYGKVN